MTKRMLIDATDPAEVRVVVLNRSRVEEFDHEIRSKAQLKGNIYLAKVTRVEPSLQAAFVDYGGNRHGFLPFSEIHPDYYRIPIADREALLAEEAALRQVEDEDEGVEPAAEPADEGEGELGQDEPEEPLDEAGAFETADGEGDAGEASAPLEAHRDEDSSPDAAQGGDEPVFGEEPAEEEPDAVEGEGDNDGRAVPHVAEGGDKLAATPEEAEASEPAKIPEDEDAATEMPPAYVAEDEAETAAASGEEAGPAEAFLHPAEGEVPADETVTSAVALESPAGEAPVEVEVEESVDTVGGDDIEDAARRRAKLLRRYKIQEVIKRGQVMLVQVAKEERGNKGAALTTYLSLPGRYCVLMPNTARGGGISRKIGSAADRRRLKTVLGDLSIPDGMAVIVRTAGSERSKAEIKRDYEYLLRLWSEIREITLNSQAPALIYEEGNLIKRAIRDLYSSDTEEILVEGEDAYKAAKAFMRSLMPSHAKKVQLYKDPAASLFLKYGVESQLGGMFDATVQLKSGGYIVINVTEALVAIDVNSGKATRERHIEETALKTNLEAAEEVARQLRLRDLAGLIVIDFIDMEEPRHNRDVERRLKDAMKSDRARIQLGRISPFGLLELSRQRLRPSLVETAMIVCTHCQGSGRVYSPETAALHLLRSLSEEGMRRPGGELQVVVGTRVALYLLNHKREQLHEIEQRYGFQLRIDADDRLHGLDHRIERPGQAREGRDRDRDRDRDRRERDRGRGRGRDEERGEGGREERGERRGREEERGERRGREEERGGERRGRDEERGERRGRDEERGERRGRDEERGERRGGERRERGQRHEQRSGEQRGGEQRGGEQRGERRAAEPRPEEEEAPEGLAAGEELPLDEGQAGVEADATPVPGAEGDDDRPRRRRRRGKRGGRRRGRRRDGQEGLEAGNGQGDDMAAESDDLGDDEGDEGEMPFEAATDEAIEAPAAASEASEATPVIEVAPEPKPRKAARQEPAVAEPEPAEAAPAENNGSAAAEPAAPPNFDVITEVDPAQPKRRGWWNKLVR